MRRRWLPSSRVLARLAALAACAVALPGQAAASAPISLGQLVAPASAVSCPIGPIEASVRRAAGVANPYMVPVEGVITSWSTHAGPGAGQSLTLRVYRPAGTANDYTVVGHDGPRALTPSTINTFPVSIPARAGDIIGIALDSSARSAPVACATNSDAGDVVIVGNGTAPVGDSVRLSPVLESTRLNVAATLLGLPRILSVTPSAGPMSGGTQVIIRGEHLSAVTAVSFGEIPVTKFTIISDTEILAVAPASPAQGTVGVTVSIGELRSTQAANFAYEPPGGSWIPSLPGAMTVNLESAPPNRRIANCVVPKLRGLKLVAARRALQRANCSLGVVSGSGKRSRARVKRQAPREGGAFAANSSVDVVLAAPKRRRR